VAIERDSVVELALTNLQERQPRNDNQEFLELAVIFPARVVCFQAPVRAMYHARWMGRVEWKARNPDMPSRCGQ